jgi:hypothetical protein
VLSGASLPAGQDPDQILFDQLTGAPFPEGKARMEEILGQARPLLDRRIEEAIAEAAQSPEAKAQAIKRVAGWLGRFRDPIGREVRLQLVQQRLNIPRRLLEQAGAPGSKPGGGPPKVGQFGQRHSQLPARTGSASSAWSPENPKRFQKISFTDRILLMGLARVEDRDGFRAETGARLPPESHLSDLLDYPPAREWVRQWEQGIQPPGLTAPGFAALDAQVRSILTEALISPEPSVSSDEAGEPGEFQIVLNRVIARGWARFSQRIKRALAEAEAKQDAELQSRLMKEYLDVQRKMKESNRFI